MSIKKYNDFINEMAKFVDITTELADDEYKVFIVNEVVGTNITDEEFMLLSENNGVVLTLDGLVNLWNDNKTNLMPGNSTIRILPQVIYSRKKDFSKNL